MTNLNYAFLSIVDLPELSFEGLCALWPGAGDSKEHDALAALPLRAELLNACNQLVAVWNHGLGCLVACA